MKKRHAAVEEAYAAQVRSRAPLSEPRTQRVETEKKKKTS
jgi:hypothetical protein